VTDNLLWDYIQEQTPDVLVEERYARLCDRQRTEHKAEARVGSGTVVAHDQCPVRRQELEIVHASIGLLVAPALVRRSSGSRPLAYQDSNRRGRSSSRKPKLTSSKTISR
jgi:hypothetical protein